MKRLAVLVVVLLTGCAHDYALYSQRVSDMAIAQAAADKAKWQSMAKIAENGTDAAKVAAVMAMALGSGLQAGHSGQGLQPPRDAGDIWFRWASILIPTWAQVHIAGKSADVAMRQSDNSRDVAVSTNQAFVGMGAQIQAPAANVSTTAATTNTTTNTAGDYGNVGAGAYTSTPTDSHAVTDSHNTDSHNTDSHVTNPVTVTPAGKVCTVDPTTFVLTCI